MAQGVVEVSVNTKFTFKVHLHDNITKHLPHVSASESIKIQPKKYNAIIRIIYRLSEEN